MYSCAVCKKPRWRRLLRRPRLKVAVVEAIAGTRIGAELLPELVEFKSFGDPMPEAVELHQEFGPASCTRRRWSGRGLCIRGIHYGSMREVIIEACEGNRLAFSASSAAVLSVLCVLRF